MFVTSGKNISIYDISDPAAPKALGATEVNVAYSIVYARGIDILRWKGEHHVPGASAEAARVAGTRGVTKATGWSPGLCYLTTQRT